MGQEKSDNPKSECKTNDTCDSGVETHFALHTLRVMATVKHTALPIIPPIIWSGWKSPTIRQPTLALSSQPAMKLTASSFCFSVMSTSAFLISGKACSVKFRSGSGEEIPRRSGTKFLVFHGLLVIGFHPCGALVATARRLSACPTYRAIYAGAPSCRAGFEPLNFLRL